MLYKRIFWIIRCQCYHWSSMLFGSTGESPTPPILMKQPGRPNCGLNCSKRDLFLRESFLNCQSASGLQYKVRGYIPTHTHIYIYMHTHTWYVHTWQLFTACECLGVFKLWQLDIQICTKYSQTFWKNYCVLFEPRGCWARYGRTVMLASNFFCACWLLPIAVSLSHHPIIQMYSAYIYIYVYVCNVCM